MPPNKKEEEEEDPNVYTKTPILLSDGAITCLFNEAALSNLVTFKNHTIHFDYQAYFDVNEDDLSSNSNDTMIQSKVNQIEKELFSVVGRKAGLLLPNKKEESTLEPSDISCQSLLGDYNNETPPTSDRVRTLRGKLKKENEIFMLGLSSAPQDQLDTNKECDLDLLPPKKGDKLSKKNLICKPIQAGLTTYIATQGSGTIVDPTILETNILKLIKDGMEKDKFTASDEEYSLLYLGVTRPTTVQQDTVYPQLSALQGSNQETISPNPDSTKNEFTSYGATFLIFLCLAFFSSMFLLRRKLKHKREEMEASEDTEKHVDEFHPEITVTSSKCNPMNCQKSTTINTDETKWHRTASKPAYELESTIPTMQTTNNTNKLEIKNQISTEDSCYEETQAEVIFNENGQDVVISNSQDNTTSHWCCS